MLSQKPQRRQATWLYLQHVRIISRGLSTHVKNNHDIQMNDRSLHMYWSISSECLTSLYCIKIVSVDQLFPITDVSGTDTHYPSRDCSVCICRQQIMANSGNQFSGTALCSQVDLQHEKFMNEQTDRQPDGQTD